MRGMKMQTIAPMRSRHRTNIARLTLLYRPTKASDFPA